MIHESCQIHALKSQRGLDKSSRGVGVSAVGKMEWSDDDSETTADFVAGSTELFQIAHSHLAKGTTVHWVTEKNRYRRLATSHVDMQLMIWTMLTYRQIPEMPSSCRLRNEPPWHLGSSH